MSRLHPGVSTVEHKGLKLLYRHRTGGVYSALSITLSALSVTLNALTMYVCQADAQFQAVTYMGGDSIMQNLRVSTTRRMIVIRALIVQWWCVTAG